MHPTCLHEFEHDIDYDEDTGKVEGSHYCPMHHPMKHKLLDEDNFESDEEEAPAKMPPLPPLLTCQECDWRLCATGCVHPELAPLSCQREGCNKLVHHLCQIKWHESIMYEATNIARYCRIHDMKYSSRSQQQLIPTSVGGQDFNQFSNLLGTDDHDDRSASRGPDGDHDGGNNNCGTGKKENEEDDDGDSEDDMNDDCDSADDGLEAAFIAEGAEFEDVEDEIDDMYGVDFVPQCLPGAPPGWFPPGPPDNFVYTPERGAPTENELDNPGGWNLFSFAGRSNASKTKYEGHFTPCGAKVVPANSLGTRQIGNWKFYYKGWQGDDFDKGTYVRDDAAYGNLKPASRKGCLDVNVLCTYGLSQSRMQDDDALFFYQLLFPICDPKKSGIDGDNRMFYFTYASMCTNAYANMAGAGSGYGHGWETTTPAELVRWTACPIRNGGLDGKPSTLMARWTTNDRRYDPVVDNGISCSRWKQIKRAFKLNVNWLQKKKGNVDYDPCAKYDFICKVLVHNMNNVTESADLDGTFDESTWGFGGYSGDCGGRLINKPVSRGECCNTL